MVVRHFSKVKAGFDFAPHGTERSGGKRGSGGGRVIQGFNEIEIAAEESGKGGVDKEQRVD